MSKYGAYVIVYDDLTLDLFYNKQSSEHFREGSRMFHVGSDSTVRDLVHAVSLGWVGDFFEPSISEVLEW